MIERFANTRVISHIFAMIFIFFISQDNLIPSKIRVKKIELCSVKKVGEGVLNYPGLPAMGYNISAIDESYFYIYDSKGKNPFYALDKKTLQLKGFGSWGQGPGEVLMGSPSVINSTGSKIFIFLPLQRKLVVFSNDLKFLKEIKPEAEMGVLYMISDNEGVSVNLFSMESLAEKVKIDENGKVLSVLKYYPFKKVLTKNQNMIKLGKNPLLKQGAIYFDKEGNFFFAHYYSSLIFKSSPIGDVFEYEFGPRNIEVPEAEVKERGGIISGDPERCIQSYLSLTSDGKYLYALFSGEEITMEKVIAFRTGKGKEINLGEGKFVDVFRKEDLSYVLSFELPVLATSIAVDNENLYVTTAENEPCILIFKKPKF